VGSEEEAAVSEELEAEALIVSAAAAASTAGLRLTSSSKG